MQGRHGTVHQIVHIRVKGTNRVDQTLATP
jgi:hypothetical protein